MADSSKPVKTAVIIVPGCSEAGAPAASWVLVGPIYNPAAHDPADRDKALSTIEDVLDQAFQDITGEKVHVFLKQGDEDADK